MLDELATKGTPWPGAPVQSASAVPKEVLEGFEGLEEAGFPDEWTMPDEWQTPAAFTAREFSANGETRPKIFVPQPSAERGEVRE